MDAAVNHPQQGDFRITLLGTGSPRPSLTRHHPAAFVQWGEGGHMLVDAGDGVVSQLLAAGIPLESITQIALTHMHWDHILGYPALIWGSWNMGRLALTVTGPVGTRTMHDQLVERYYRAQAEWAMKLGFPRAGFDDILVRDVPLDDPKVGDVLVIPATGAYGHSMANNYNAIPRPPVIFCRDGNARAVVRRETYEDLTARDDV